MIVINDKFSLVKFEYIIEESFADIASAVICAN